MHAYTNPAFHPAFVSRIPKPAPRHPHHGKQDFQQCATHPQLSHDNPKAPSGDAQHPLEELPSTSHMQPAQQSHDLPAAFGPLDQVQKAQNAQQGAVQAYAIPISPDAHKQVNVASPSAEEQQHQQQQHDSSLQLFQQPGHEVVCVVWEDSAGQQHDVNSEHAARHAVPAEHAAHAGLDSIEQREAAEGGLEEQRSFGDMCRRLGAVIEVRQRKRNPSTTKLFQARHALELPAVSVEQCCLQSSCPHVTCGIKKQPLA